MDQEQQQYQNQEQQFQEEKQRGKKKKILILIGVGIFVLFIIIIGGLEWRYQNHRKALDTLNTESSEIERDDWKIFEKIDLWGNNNCSIKIPNDWLILDENTRAIPPKRIDNEKTYIYISIECLTKEEAKEYIRKGERLDLESICNKENFSILQTDKWWATKGDPHLIKEFCISNKDGSQFGIVEFNASYGNDWIDLEEIVRPELDSLNQIFPTFNFIKDRKPSVGLCEYIISYKKEERGAFYSRKELINEKMREGGVGGLECPFEVNGEDYYIYFNKLKFVKILDKNKEPLIEIGSKDIGLWEFQEFGNSIFYLIDDINFDGYIDLGVLSGSGYGGVNFSYDFYIFNPLSKGFIKSISLFDYQINYDKKEIRETYKSGSTYCGNIYQFDGKGYLMKKSPDFDCGEEEKYIEIEGIADILENINYKN